MSAMRVRQEQEQRLRAQLRSLGRAATVVALLTSPASFLFFRGQGYSNSAALALALLVAVCFRGGLDVFFRRIIPWPSLFGFDDARLQEEDVVARRRSWFWRFWARLVAFYLLVAAAAYGADRLTGDDPASFLGTTSGLLSSIGSAVANPTILAQFVFVFAIFVANFAILFGPLLAMNILQAKAYEPGSADWGVRLDDVRGQEDAKTEVRKVVELWQSGEIFQRQGGKREKGLLFLGPPGVGKTLLAKAIASGFNSPFLSMPGSAFQATFIGIDVIVVRYVAWKAKRLARKWGGQCVVFIDEIDALGMRRASLAGAAGGGRYQPAPTRYEELAFYGDNGALTPSGDLILESRPWRDRLFAERAERSPASPPLLYERIRGFLFPGMLGGSGLALNQLLVVMDGVDSPPFLRRLAVANVNKVLDALFVVPQRIGPLPLRLPRPKPRSEQVFFIGATNVPLQNLDPALTRPGRLGRHVWFRSPTKQDRLDIFDLYLGKVAHDPELDDPRAREELARITSGFSPAKIEQACSLALTYALHEGREAFTREDLLEAMTTLEAGTRVNVAYTPAETTAVAIHEAGHAVCAHVAMREQVESTRLSVRQRGGALGHHMAIEREERFSSFRHEEMAKLGWTLGAMAAEYVFYGESSVGVGGDIHSATGRAAWMVGSCGMGPERIEQGLRGRSAGRRAEERERVLKRFEEIGLQLMSRAGSAPMLPDPVDSVLADAAKRSLAAQILGQAFVRAYAIVTANRAAVERLAEELAERGEIFGDDLLRLLEESRLVNPEIDYLADATWPVL
jgi:ATP-dependent Zn protease